MVESLLAISITTIAGAALLTSIGAAVHASSYATRQMVARGLGAQMMDEIAAARFPSIIASQLATIPSGIGSPAITSAGTQTSILTNGQPMILTTGQPGILTTGQPTRDQFVDIDDYSRWSASPPVDRVGRPLGYEATDIGGTSISRPAVLRPDERFLQQFTREVSVERVVADPISGWQVTTGESGYRRVTVRVLFFDGSAPSAVLSEIIRIFSYVPVAP